MTHSYYGKYKEYPHAKFFINYTNIYNKSILREYESDLYYLNDVGFLGSELETLGMSLYKLKMNFKKQIKNQMHKLKKNKLTRIMKLKMN